MARLESVEPSEILASGSVGVSGVAIFAGAFVSLALCILFGLFTAAVGLTARSASVWISLFLLLVIVIPFFVGGFAATRWARAGRYSFPYLHGLATWAVATIGLFAFIGSQAANFVGLSAAQLGLAGFTSVQGNALLEQIAEMKPQLETEVKIKEGKAVTTLIIHPEKAGSSMRELAESAREESRSLASSRRERESVSAATTSIEAAGRKAGWGGFLTLTAALLSTFAGSWGSGLVVARARRSRR
jgi:hypothetical protein